MNNEIFLKDEYITIGQLLKKIGLIDTGGQAKAYLISTKILINDKKPKGRSAKVKIGDIVWVNNKVFVIKKLENQYEK
ncbi:RNA-binding S4 domain-containing protein [Mycoplasmopsis caviae]|uniref:RNA-binding S4 domain-containing protein n=1 Tax=Mycoplasmopsis caviae TaxID=55603 RepID=A0A3P8LAR7_9BACT|nr:RNA-binding S4 domain-containing protein [Mycoplasmopsis caviae]UUD35255.1 RNA-binding S4 domain-containing protein [Mycoplasmopsis caviae]VDR41961.1 s4-like RNA-binding protein [Mycoplasmopsis caviae]